MTKKHFIELADTIKANRGEFSEESLFVLAAFCKVQNPRFNAGRWFGYIRGTNGPSGGKIKKKKKKTLSQLLAGM